MQNKMFQRIVSKSLFKEGHLLLILQKWMNIIITEEETWSIIILKEYAKNMK